MSKGVVKIRSLYGDGPDNGYKVGDIFEASLHGDYYYFYDNAGLHRMRHKSEFELIDDATRMPVRTVTRKEIVPGKYGPLVVGGNGSILLPQACYTPDELREAAHTLNQIAEALEDI